MTLPYFARSTQRAAYVLCNDPDTERTAEGLAAGDDRDAFERWVREVLADSGYAYDLDDVDFDQLIYLLRP